MRWLDGVNWGVNPRPWLRGCPGLRTEEEQTRPSVLAGGTPAPFSAWVPALPTSGRTAAHPSEPCGEPHDSLHSTKASGARERVPSTGRSQEAGPREDSENDMFMPHGFSRFGRGRVVFAPWFTGMFL